MSRAWKQTPTHLPGWDRYRPDVAPRKKAFQKHRLKTTKARSSIRSHTRKPLVGPPRLSRPNPRKPTVTVCLTIESIPPATALFKRTQGIWHCIAATPSVEWMLRVRHPDAIKRWLLKKTFSFHWSPADSNSIKAGETPSEVRTVAPQSATASASNDAGGSRAGTPVASLNKNMPVVAAAPMLPYAPGLERNGVTQSSPLNPAGMSQPLSNPLIAA